jgi:hypothetical protein
MSEPVMVLLALLLIIAVDVSSWVEACWVTHFFTRKDNWTEPLGLYWKAQSLVPRYILLIFAAALALLAYDTEDGIRTAFSVGALLAFLLYAAVVAWTFYRDLKPWVAGRTKKG